MSSLIAERLGGSWTKFADNELLSYIDPWCNGNTADFGSVVPSSSLGGSTSIPDNPRVVRDTCLRIVTKENFPFRASPPMVSPRAVYFRLEILCILNFGVPALVWTMFVRIFVIYILVSDCIWSAAVRRIRPDEFLFLKSCARLSLFLRGLPEAENGTGGPDESNGIQRTLKYV